MQLEPLDENEGVRTAPRLVAWSLALAVVALVAGGLVLDGLFAVACLLRVERGPPHGKTT